MRRFAVLLGLLVLAACGPTRQERLDALNKLVGLREADVVSQLGLPARTYEADGVRFLAYEERRTGYATGLYRSGGWGPYGWYGMGYVSLPPPIVERLCVTTVEIAGGVVRRVDLRGEFCGS